MLDIPRTPLEQSPEALEPPTVAPKPAAPAPPAVTPAPAGSNPPGTAEPPRRRGWMWLVLAVLVVLGVAAYFLWPQITGAKSAAAAKAAAKGPAAIPVVAA